MKDKSLIKQSALCALFYVTLITPSETPNNNLTFNIIKPITANFNNINWQYNNVACYKEQYEKIGLPINLNSRYWLNAELKQNNQKVSLDVTAFDATYFYNKQICRANKKQQISLTLNKEPYTAELVWPNDFDQNACAEWDISDYFTQCQTTPSPQTKNEANKATTEVMSTIHLQQQINSEKRQKYFLITVLIASWLWFLHKTYKG